MTSVRIAYSLILGLGIGGFLIWFLIQGILPDFYFLSSTHDVYPLAILLLGGLVPFILVMSIFWYIRAIKEYQYRDNTGRGGF